MRAAWARRRQAPVSQETRERMRKAKLGQKRPAGARMLFLFLHAMLAEPVPHAQKHAFADALRLWCHAATRRRIGLGMRGHEVSEQTRARLSAAARAYWAARTEALPLQDAERLRQQEKQQQQAQQQVCAPPPGEGLQGAPTWHAPRRWQEDAGA